MADQNYPIPENPAYNPIIRALQNTDPAQASGVFNPLFEQLIANTHAVKLETDKAAPANLNYIDLTADYEKSEIAEVRDYLWTLPDGAYYCYDGYVAYYLRRTTVRGNIYREYRSYPDDTVNVTVQLWSSDTQLVSIDCDPSNIYELKVAGQTIPTLLAIDKLLDGKLDKSGGKMTGTLRVESFLLTDPVEGVRLEAESGAVGSPRLTLYGENDEPALLGGVANPVYGGDAVNKDYVVSTGGYIDVTATFLASTYAENGEVDKWLLNTGVGKVEDGSYKIIWDDMPFLAEVQTVWVQRFVNVRQIGDDGFAHERRYVNGNLVVDFSWYSDGDVVGASLQFGNKFVQLSDTVNAPTLPPVTAADNGKILKVQNGKWVAVTP